MRTGSSLLSVLVILASAAVLLFCVISLSPYHAEVVPNPYFVENSPDSTSVTVPNVIAHYYSPPSTTRIVLSIVLAASSLVGAAIVVSRLSVSRKILGGAMTAAASATLAFLVLCGVEGGLPQSRTYYFAIVISPAIGVAAAWVAARWWPNKSLVRPRAE